MTFMLCKSVRIPIWLIALGFLATVAIGAAAGGSRSFSDIRTHPSFRIVASRDAGVVVSDRRDGHGVLVTEVTCGVLRAGDVILSVDGHAIRNKDQLEAAVAQIPALATFRVELLRDGSSETIAVGVNPAPDLQAVAGSFSMFGLTVADVPPEGVVITNVDPGSLVAEIGMHKGDVIRAINGEPVRNTDEFQKLIRGLLGVSASFMVSRDGEMNVFTIGR